MSQPINAPFAVLSFVPSVPGNGSGRRVFEGEYHTFEKALKIHAELSAEGIKVEIVDNSYKSIVDSLGKMVVASIIDYDGKEIAPSDSEILYRAITMPLCTAIDARFPYFNSHGGGSIFFPVYALMLDEEIGEVGPHSGCWTSIDSNNKCE